MMKRSHKSNFHFLQIMMTRMMRRVAKRSPEKLLDDDANLKVCADYNIDCEIVSLISSLAKTLHEIKHYQKSAELLISRLPFQCVIREICVNVSMISDMR